MSAFARLCALCHLDLDLSCGYQIAAGHTETSAGYLLDRRAAVLIRSGRCDTLIALTAFTGIALAMQMVHRDRQCLMCFLRNGTVGHRTGLETFYDLGCRFYFFDRNCLLRIYKI